MHCPVCRALARPAIPLGDLTLHACDACGSWSSDAQARGAQTSFTPASYFANADADCWRWSDLFARLDAAGGAAGAERPALRVLDVGCGRGDFLAWLAREHPGTQRAGIELDAERAIEARAANPDARIVAGDALAGLAMLEGEFDLVTLWDVFEHLVDPGAALRALAARVALGGYVFVQTIHEHSIVPAIGRWSYALTGGRLRFLARRTHEAHHLVFFSRTGLDRLAADAGLVVSARWYDRLALARMDGGRLMTVATAALLALENRFGNGLFVNVLLRRSR